MRQVTNRGLEFLKKQEGWMSLPYLDSAGFLTIGHGHLLSKSELMSGKIRIGYDYVKWQAGLTPEQGKDLLDQDLNMVEGFLTYDAGTGRLEDHEYDALCSFVYNVGTGSYLGSTLRKYLLIGRKDLAADELPRWKYAGGKTVKGLVKRRQAEKELWLHANYSSP